MNVKHEVKGATGSEHSIVVSMTPLEAELWMRAQPTTVSYARAGIRKALSGCDQRVERVTGTAR